MPYIIYLDIPSPLGTLWVAQGPDGIVRVDFFLDEEHFCQELARRTGTRPAYRPDQLRAVAGQFAAYFSGERREFDLLVDLGRLSTFQRDVLEAVRTVPYGETYSYRDIAWAIGKPGAARAVGGAVATNPISIVVPCHRIVRSDGTPGEYAWKSMGSQGRLYKLLLLELEQRGGVHAVADCDEPSGNVSVH